MDLFSVLTVVIPAIIMVMGFVFLVISLVGQGDEVLLKSKVKRPGSQVGATYWGRYYGRTTTRTTGDTLAVPKITPIAKL